MSKLERCLVLDKAEWYENTKFLAWLNSPASTTWHDKMNPPGEMSDVFVVYDHGDSSDRPMIPDEIWNELMEEAERVGFKYGVVWIRNLGDL